MAEGNICQQVFDLLVKRRPPATASTVLPGPATACHGRPRPRGEGTFAPLSNNSLTFGSNAGRLQQVAAGHASGGEVTAGHGRGHGLLQQFTARA